MRHLLVTAGPQKGHIFQVCDAFNVLIGRSRHATYQFTDPRMSRVHCEVEMKGKRVLLSDLESGAGTFLNGKRISDAAQIKANDIIRAGDTEFRYVDDVADDPTIMPTVQPAPRPVLMSQEKLHQLTGVKLSHYEVGEVLAKGHSGLIFKAYCFKYDRDVAFKVMWPEFSQNDEEIMRFVRAMKTMLRLKHPNLVTLYGAGKTGPYCWVAMELVEGDSLTTVISRLGATNLDWRNALRVSYYVCKALQYAHGNSIVHRNITPQNVLVGKRPEETKLGDLMLAKAQEGALAAQITRAGQILGDIRFMAPERTGTNATIDARSDLYSLGALMYALLTGKPPFEGKNLIDTITKIRTGDFVTPKKFQPGMPDVVVGLVNRLLARKPDDRYASASDVIKDMERIGASLQVKL